MSNTYQIYLISDSTGETLDRIFLALKAQFLNIEYKVHSYSFTRTENQILKILGDAKKNESSIIFTSLLLQYLINESRSSSGYLPFADTRKIRPWQWLILEFAFLFRVD
mgnify:CR=1 FL=1